MPIQRDEINVAFQGFIEQALVTEAELSAAEELTREQFDALNNFRTLNLVTTCRNLGVTLGKLIGIVKRDSGIERIRCLVSEDMRQAVRICNCPFDSLTRLSETHEGRRRVDCILKRNLGVYLWDQISADFSRDQYRRVWDLIIDHWDGRGNLMNEGGVTVNNRNITPQNLSEMERFFQTQEGKSDNESKGNPVESEQKYDRLRSSSRSTHPRQQSGGRHH